MTEMKRVMDDDKMTVIAHRLINAMKNYSSPGTAMMVCWWQSWCLNYTNDGDDCGDDDCCDDDDDDNGVREADKGDLII